MVEKIWNHNSAYYKWIKNNIPDNSCILDVGSGNGSLAYQLASKSKSIIGIEKNKELVNLANLENQYENVSFIDGDYLEYNFKKIKFDVIIFVASIHHMDMEKALNKSKKLLNKNGILIIVGLSKPSTITDYIIEVLRIIPCFIISKMKRIKTMEDLNIDTSYDIPTMNKIREICDKNLEKYYIRQALYYRYLLKWIKER